MDEGLGDSDRAGGAPRRPPLPVVIDADPGIDDVVALSLALRSPQIRVLALTTSYGNAPLALTTRNARRLLELLGRTDVPLHPGADRPLRRPLVTAAETHGESGVGYAPVPPPTEDDARADPAALLRVLERVPGPVTLITLGPLTNLALALEKDPDLVRARVSRHLGMFGNIAERGNTNRWADFNAWCDPEAVERVLAAGLGTGMVGLDVTRRLTFSRTEVDGMREAGDPVVRWLQRALSFYVEFHRAQERLDGCVVNDVLPVGEVLAPGLLAWRHIPLTVVLDEGEHRGHTREHPDGIPTAVALGVDIPRTRRLLGRVFGDRLPPA